MSAGETGDFAVGDRVLVPFTDKYYEAKILKAEYRTNDPRYPDGQWFYYLHYSGWNKKFDEWVEAPGIVRAGPQVVGADTAHQGSGPPGAGPGGPRPRKLLKDRFQKKRPLGQLGAAAGEAAPGSAAVALPVHVQGGPSAGGPSLSMEAAAGMPGGGAAAPPGSGAMHLDLDMPPIIKKALLDDYDAIVTDAKLTPLPRSPCVADVLRRYCEAAAEVHGGIALVEDELAHGLRTYFDKCLMAVLLYRTERPQAISVLSDGRLPSSVYGTEHLLRLLLKLSELLGAVGGGGAMGEDQLMLTTNAVQDFVYWIADNMDALGLLLPKDQFLDYHEVLARISAPGAPNCALAATAAAALAAPPAAASAGGDVAMADVSPGNGTPASAMA